MKPVLPFVETMVTQACNLACHGCSNYSDLVHQGYVPWQQGRRSLVRWLDRIDIPDFGILGGEPLMHPHVEDWIIGLRELMPTAQIRFTTNGLLLAKKMHLLRVMEQVGNIVFKIAVHVRDPELEKTIQTILDMYEWQEIEEYGVKRLTTGNQFRFHVRRPDVFWKTYVGNYENMAPHDSDPLQAFQICCQQTCPLLYQDRIYKCSTNGLLREVLTRAGNPNYESWAPYLNDGIAADCSDQDLNLFLANFGKPHQVCGMCPSRANTDSKLIHIENVSFKKYILQDPN